MSRKEVDLIDQAALIIIPYFSGVAFNAMSFEIKVFGGFDFGATFWSGSGVVISNAALITMVGLAWIAATNLFGDAGPSGAAAKYAGKDDLLYKAMLAVAFGLLPLYVFVPPLHDFIAGNDAVTFVAVLLQSALAVGISYEK